jgi:hypothetical protein
MKQVLVLTLVLSLTFSHAQSVRSLFSGRTTGEATFYGAGADSGGTCMYNNPTHNLGLPTVAIGAFGNAEKCGMCVMIYPSGTGSGNSDFPNRQRFMAYVNNQCPECGPNNLDIAQGSDGRWNMEWQAVDCPVQGNIQLQLKSGSSIWHTEISARNFKVPITSIDFFINGAWQSLARQTYNYFVLSGTVTLPVKGRLTSVFDEVKEFTINDYSKIEPALIDSGVQFSGSGRSSSTLSNPPSNPPPASSPSSGIDCNTVAHAMDPNNLYWVEVSGVSGDANLKLQCTGISEAISCVFAYGIKWQCDTNGQQCQHPRTVSSGSTTCPLPQSRLVAAAQAGDSAVFTNTNSNASTTLPAYGIAIIVVGTILLIAIIVVVLFFTRRTKKVESV